MSARFKLSISLKRVPVFKNVIVYRIGPDWSATVAQIEESLDSSRFVPCGASQEKSIGWGEPRGEAHGPLVESVGGQILLKLMIESKALPGSVITKKAKERAAQIEATTGRKPGKKELGVIKDDIKLELMPLAFSKESATLVWIDPEARMLVLDAGSQGRADEVVTLLVKSLAGFAVALIDTQVSPVAAMSEWLITQEAPAGFTVDRECELKAADESKAVVRYTRHPLDTEEVKQYVESGKLPTRLAMTWDGRVSFVLTEGMQIKKVQFLDVVFEGTSGSGKDNGFDADAAIATGELQKLLPDLLEALGGEVVRPQV
jgi:recombination associated protein RdgC